MTLALVLLVHLGVAVSTVLLLVSVRQLRSRGSGSAIHDAMEAAFLGGGPGRVADAAIAGMHADGRLTVGGPGIVAVQRAVAHHPVEQLVLQEHAAAPNGALHALRLAVMRGWAVQQVGDVLAARGLLVAPAECRTVRKWGVIQAAVCFISLPVAVLLSIVVAIGSPPGGSGPLAFSVLPILFVGGLFGANCASAARHRVTHGGRRALLNFQAGVPSGASLPAGQPPLTQPSVAQLVAAHGLAGIPDPLLREQLRVAARLRPGRDYVPAPHTAAAAVAWCSGAQPGSGTGCGGAGSGCGAGSCGGGGGSGGGSAGGSGCGGSSGSSCGGSSGSSCGGGGGGGGSSCGGGGGGS
ncbi:TIGR04222 domain-containing membrane protein [Streptomyces sp. NPDC088400]|uniref:TIGR04222 domain-containing membrane protein n=1 Tax=Streptomyces sp. NPDC088400 TaxID=3365861 RepID=UPI0038256084